jgi:hypothetical protein
MILKSERTPLREGCRPRSVPEMCDVDDARRNVHGVSSSYLTTQEVTAMNAFYEHHQDNIRFGYRCFDRILLNGLIPPFQQPERVIGFFNTYRQQYPVSRKVSATLPTSSKAGSRTAPGTGTCLSWTPCRARRVCRAVRSACDTQRDRRDPEGAGPARRWR